MSGLFSWRDDPWQRGEFCFLCVLPLEARTAPGTQTALAAQSIPVSGMNEGVCLCVFRASSLETAMVTAP